MYINIYPGLGTAKQAHVMKTIVNNLKIQLDHGGTNTVQTLI